MLIIDKYTLLVASTQLKKKWKQKPKYYRYPFNIAKIFAIRARTTASFTIKRKTYLSKKDPMETEANIDHDSPRVKATAEQRLG